MNNAIMKLHVLDNKREQESKFRNWTEQNTERKTKYGDILSNLESAYTEIYPFNKELAIASGLLKQSYSHLGLSLGDRACLALASHLNLPLYTANKAWSELDTDLTITQIR